MSLTRRGFFGAVAGLVAAAKLAPLADSWEPVHTHFLERNTRTGELREPLWAVPDRAKMEGCGELPPYSIPCFLNEHCEHTTEHEPGDPQYSCGRSDMQSFMFMAFDVREDERGERRVTQLQSPWSLPDERKSLA